MDSSPAPAEKASALHTILCAGVIAGVLDITAVIVVHGYQGVAPQRILQSVAVGWLGRKEAYAGGWPTALLGLGSHFLIALGAAAVFYAASRRISWLVRHAITAGLLYGIAVYLFMNLVVLPLSAVPPSPFPPPRWVTVFLAHLFCVGLPIALVVRRGSSSNV